MAIARSEKLELHAYSDYPGMHLYSANWLENKTGKKDICILKEVQSALKQNICQMQSIILM